jgi:hypothetical protein
MEGGMMGDAPLLPGVFFCPFFANQLGAAAESVRQCQK